MPEPIYSGSVLLASTEIHRNPRHGRNPRGDGRSSKFDNVGMIMASLLSLALVVWFAARMIERRANRRTYYSRRKLFKELCRAHHLPRVEKRLLRQLARQHRLADPTALFLRPELFELGANEPAMQYRQRRLLTLRDKLFAGLSNEMELGGAEHALVGAGQAE